MCGLAVKQEMVRLHSELTLVQRDREEIEKLQQTVAEKAASLVGWSHTNACMVATIGLQMHCVNGWYSAFLHTVRVFVCWPPIPAAMLTVYLNWTYCPCYLHSTVNVGKIVDVVCVYL